MTTPKRPRDPNQLAKFIVDAATGEKGDLQPAPPSEEARNRGRLGGVMRAKALTPEERIRIAEKGANSRWKKGRPVLETKE